MLLTLIIFAHALPAGAAGLELYYDNEYHTYNGSIFSLYIDGEKINPPMEPLVFNNRTLVPMREVFEKMGAVVDYNNTTREITVTKTGLSVKLQIGNNEAYVNGVKKNIPDGVVPKLITKVGVVTKTMVPVRFISESLEFLVDFDGATGSIHITSPKTEAEKIAIKKPEIKKESDVKTVITLKLTGEYKESIKPAVTSAGVLYFDLKNVVYEGASKTEINHGAVKSVRLGLHEGYTRVAVDMENHLKYEAEMAEDKRSITIAVTKKDDGQAGDEVTTSPEETVPPEETTPPAEEIPPSDNPVNITTDVSGLMKYTPSAGVKYVVIDAGHGGKDPGAQGIIDDKKYHEKDIALSVARLVVEELEKKGVEVVMTREGDTYPTLDERAQIANQKDAAMFVSIHVNSAANAPNANGIEVYYAGKNNRNYYGVTSKELANSVLKAMISETGARSRGVKTENHVVTRKSVMPAVLVEIGFISNQEEIKKIIDQDYQKLLAQGIVRGIMEEIDGVSVPDRKTLATKLVAEEVGQEKAEEYINEVWK